MGKSITFTQADDTFLFQKIVITNHHARLQRELLDIPLTNNIDITLDQSLIETNYWCDLFTHGSNGTLWTKDWCGTENCLNKNKEPYERHNLKSVITMNVRHQSHLEDAQEFMKNVLKMCEDLQVTKGIDGHSYKNYECLCGFVQETVMLGYYKRHGFEKAYQTFVELDPICTQEQFASFGSKLARPADSNIPLYNDRLVEEREYRYNNEPNSLLWKCTTMRRTNYVGGFKIQITIYEMDMRDNFDKLMTLLNYISDFCAKN